MTLSYFLRFTVDLWVQVTCMFYLIDATTKDVVEGGRDVAEQRPPWLGMHAGPLLFTRIWQLST